MPCVFGANLTDRRVGCYAPTTIATPALIEEIHRTILEPSIAGMRKERFPFVGILFTGFMITKDGPKVLEYNVRGGDPETETLMPLLNNDLTELMLACADGYLDTIDLNISPRHSATVIAVAGGYPGSYSKGDIITFKEAPADTVIFHAGTKLDANEQCVTNGGRVMACTATGASLQKAVDTAYQSIQSISFSNMFYRKDIAHRALRPGTATNPTSHPPNSSAPLTYADAGVSIETGNTLVKRIKPLVQSTARAGADATIGGFGGLVDLAAAGFSTPPRLVCAIDGVGTKLNIAHALGKHDTVGIDCVAMNVNDLMAQGVSEVLAFLDCYTCGKLDADIATAFVEGVAEGCRQAGCALVGGETAEMPGLFTGGDAAAADAGVYDAVGAAVGALAEGLPLLPRTQDMRAGDVLLGLASSGVHSNGFSLVRKILQRVELDVRDPAPWSEGALAQSVGASLLTPTRIYVRSLAVLVRQRLVLGMAHITGGGLYDNIPRMLPKHLAAEMHADKWSVPPVLRWLKSAGKLSEREFATTFNTGLGKSDLIATTSVCGIRCIANYASLGMVCVVKAEHVDQAIRQLTEAGETVSEVGRLVDRAAGTEGCVVHGGAAAWA